MAASRAAVAAAAARSACFLRLESLYRTVPAPHTAPTPRIPPRRVELEMIPASSSSVESWPAAAAAAMTGRRSVAVEVAVAVAETELVPLPVEEGLGLLERDGHAERDAETEEELLALTEMEGGLVELPVTVILAELLPEVESLGEPLTEPVGLQLPFALGETLPELDTEGLAVVEPLAERVGLPVPLLLLEIEGDTDADPDVVTVVEALAEVV